MADRDLTGDPEFRKFKDSVKIECLSVPPAIRETRPGKSASFRYLD
jgi:hypothetical protein